jgi:Zn-dependent peptidase ImmA (M78 family)
VNSRERRLEEQHRLLAIREHLKIHARPESPDFRREVAAACVDQVQSVIDAHAHERGEEIISAISTRLSIHFEEVRTPEDIFRLEKKYLKEQRELGFGLLSDSLADKEVDALLFQKTNVSSLQPHKWVAVLNLQETESRAYWSRPHEIVHRLAEPPQKRLPFYRHRSENENVVERLVDFTAAELAFPASVFNPLVAARTKEALTWELVLELRLRFAPTASIYSVAKACVNCWPAPAFFLTASVRGRRGRPWDGVALRAKVEGSNAAARSSGILFCENMRVPQTSPMWWSLEFAESYTDREDLAKWETSTGHRLPSRSALTSAKSLRGQIYGLVSLAY